MKNSSFTRRLKAALALIMALFSICGAAGCNVPASVPGGNETPAPSPSATVSVISAKPSPTETVSEEPASTPAPKPEPLGYIDLDNCTQEQKEEADRIIKAYLNAESQYTTAALSETGFFEINNYNEKENYYLGTLEVSNYGFSIYVQEVLLFTVKLNDRFFLICGAEDKNRKRFINPVEVPIDIVLDQNDSQTAFVIYTKSVQLYDSLQSDGTYWGYQIASKDLPEIIEGCNEYINRPVAFSVIGRKQSLGDPGGPPKAFKIAANKRLGVARNFAASLYIPEYNKAKFIKYLKKAGKISGDPLVTINTVADMYTAELDKTLLVTGFFVYKK